jgi:hypothetical protein
VAAVSSKTPGKKKTQFQIHIGIKKGIARKGNGSWETVKTLKKQVVLEGGR